MIENMDVDAIIAHKVRVDDELYLRLEPWPTWYIPHANGFAVAPDIIAKELEDSFKQVTKVQ